VALTLSDQAGTELFDLPIVWYVILKDGAVNAGPYILADHNNGQLSDGSYLPPCYRWNAAGTGFIAGALVRNAGGPSRYYTLIEWLLTEQKVPSDFSSSPINLWNYQYAKAIGSTPPGTQGPWPAWITAFETAESIDAYGLYYLAAGIYFTGGPLYTGGLSGLGADIGITGEWVDNNDHLPNAVHLGMAPEFLEGYCGIRQAASTNLYFTANSFSTYTTAALPAGSHSSTPDITVGFWPGARDPAIGDNPFFVARSTKAAGVVIGIFRYDMVDDAWEDATGDFNTNFLAKGFDASMPTVGGGIAFYYGEIV